MNNKKSNWAKWYKYQKWDTIVMSLYLTDLYQTRYESKKSITIYVIDLLYLTMIIAILHFTIYKNS